MAPVLTAPVIISLPFPPKILSLEVLPQSTKSNGVEALDVSAIDTVAVDPTCKVRAESEYSFIESVSVFSVNRSFLIV